MNWGGIQFDGLEQLQARLEAAEANVPKLMADCANAVAVNYMTLAAKLTPVDTGHAKKSWEIRGAYFRDVQNGAISASIFNNAKYVRHLEYGHRTGHVEGGRSTAKGGRFVQTGWQDGQFFLTNATKQMRQKQNLIITRRVNKFMRSMMQGGAAGE